VNKTAKRPNDPSLVTAFRLNPRSSAFIRGKALFRSVLSVQISGSNCLEIHRLTQHCTAATNAWNNYN